MKTLALNTRIGFMAGLLALLASTSGCSHLPTEDRYPSKAQVIELSDCSKLDGLKQVERALFKQGFLREVLHENDPIAFELQQNFLANTPRLILYTKTDFEVTDGKGSEPYREVRNRYRMAGCEEAAGGMYLIIVRHDPVAGDQFLGARLTQALEQSGCKYKAVAAPRSIGFYQDSTGDDLLRHIQRGKCRDYALGR